MAWVNNNKKNARFNPNRRDDRLMMSQVTSRREHKPRKEVEPEIELVSTDPAHVLGMGSETRLDWLQMGLMQASMGKLKVDALCNVLTNPSFGPSESSCRKALKALVLANLHLFGTKQKKAIQEAVGSWSSAAARRAKNGEQKERDKSKSRSRSQSSQAAKADSSSSSSASRSSTPEKKRKRSRSGKKKRRRESRSRKRSRSRDKSRDRKRR